MTLNDISLVDISRC